MEQDPEIFIRNNFYQNEEWTFDTSKNFTKLTSESLEYEDERSKSTADMLIDVIFAHILGDETYQDGNHLENVLVYIKPAYNDYMKMCKDMMKVNIINKALFELKPPFTDGGNYDETTWCAKLQDTDLERVDIYYVSMGNHAMAMCITKKKQEQKVIFEIYNSGYGNQGGFTKMVYDIPSTFTLSIGETQETLDTQKLLHHILVTRKKCLKSTHNLKEYIQAFTGVSLNMTDSQRYKNIDLNDANELILLLDVYFGNYKNRYDYLYKQKGSSCTLYSLINILDDKSDFCFTSNHFPYPSFFKFCRAWFAVAYGNLLRGEKKNQDHWDMLFKNQMSYTFMQNILNIVQNNDRLDDWKCIRINHKGTMYSISNYLRFCLMNDLDLDPYVKPFPDLITLEHYSLYVIEVNKIFDDKKLHLYNFANTLPQNAADLCNIISRMYIQIMTDSNTHFLTDQIKIPIIKDEYLLTLQIILTRLLRPFMQNFTMMIMGLTTQWATKSVDLYNCMKFMYVLMHSKNSTRLYFYAYDWCVSALLALGIHIFYTLYPVNSIPENHYRDMKKDFYTSLKFPHSVEWDIESAISNVFTGDLLVMLPKLNGSNNYWKLAPVYDPYIVKEKEKIEKMIRVLNTFRNVRILKMDNLSYLMEYGSEIMRNVKYDSSDISPLNIYEMVVLINHVYCSVCRISPLTVEVNQPHGRTFFCDNNYDVLKEQRGVLARISANLLHVDKKDHDIVKNYIITPACDFKPQFFGFFWHKTKYDSVKATPSSASSINYYINKYEALLCLNALRFLPNFVNENDLTKNMVYIIDGIICKAFECDPTETMNHVETIKKVLLQTRKLGIFGPAYYFFIKGKIQSAKNPSDYSEKAWSDMIPSLFNGIAKIIETMDRKTIFELIKIFKHSTIDLSLAYNIFETLKARRHPAFVNRIWQKTQATIVNDGIKFNNDDYIYYKADSADIISYIDAEQEVTSYEILGYNYGHFTYCKLPDDSKWTKLIGFNSKTYEWTQIVDHRKWHKKCQKCKNITPVIENIAKTTKTRWIDSETKNFIGLTDETIDVAYIIEYNDDIDEWRVTLQSEETGLVSNLYIHETIPSYLISVYTNFMTVGGLAVLLENKADGDLYVMVFASTIQKASGQNSFFEGIENTSKWASMPRFFVVPIHASMSYHTGSHALSLIYHKIASRTNNYYLNAMAGINYPSLDYNVNMQMLKFNEMINNTAFNQIEMKKTIINMFENAQKHT